MIHYTGEPAHDYEADCRDEEMRGMQHLPRYYECGEPLTGDFFWEMNDEYICTDCLKKNHRRTLDDLIY